MTDSERQVMVTGSYYFHTRSVAGLGVAFKGGRVVCSDVAPATSAGHAEILALLRGIEIASKTRRHEILILTDSSLADAVASDGVEYGEIGGLIRDLLDEHTQIAVEHRPRSFVRSAHILAKQTAKAWAAGSGGVCTWSAAELLAEVAA